MGDGAPTRPPRRDLLLAGVPLVLLLLQMAHKGHLPGGTLLGAALTLAATVGILGLLGDSPLDPRGDEAPDAPAAPDARPWWRREGAWVVLFSAALYVPTAGAFGLWDPWETHYSEVAREILTRDDWITLWWAQEGWFMSKPVLIFWMDALGMGVGTLFGVGVQADMGPGLHEWFIRMPVVALTIGALYAVYRAVAGAFGPRAGLLSALVLATMPHWFFLAHQSMTDMPFVATLTLALAMFMLAITSDPSAVAAARTVRLGRWTLRVSLWHLTVGAVLVCALPQIAYLLTRTLYFGCPEGAAASCTRALRASQVGPLQLPIEMFPIGSPGNSGVGGADSVPGSPPYELVPSALVTVGRVTVPLLPTPVHGVVWALLLYWALRLLRRERKTEGLYFVLAFLWCAISTMGKGPAGFVIPLAVAALHYLSTGRWRDLYRIRLGVGVLVFLVVGMPWYLAITARLGEEFINRFIVHDIINRTVLGVHGDTGTVQYFLWQLGYAMFPWSGLVPVAFAGWRLTVPDDAGVRQRDVARVATFWLLVAFVLFSAMATKFHHYIFPAVPGAAILVGLLLDRMLGPARVPAPPPPPLSGPATETDVRGYRDPARASAPPARAAASTIVPSLGALALASALFVVGVALFVGSWRGIIPEGGAAPPRPALGAFLAAGGGAAWVAGWLIARGADRVAAVVSVRAAYLSASFGAAGLGAAGVVALVARDLAHRDGSPHGSMRLIHTFVYNYSRPFPSQWLDYSPILVGFGAAAVVACALLAVRPARAHAVRGLVVLASLFAVWALDVYKMDLTDHWSQRGLFERYYRLRRPRPAGDPRYRFEPVAAYQMNWKGENFYTGNHVVALECGLKYCHDRTATWLEGQRGQRVYFVTEHSRVPSLQRVVEATGGTARRVTTERDDNKFVLVVADIGRGGGSRATDRPRGTTAPAPAWQPGTGTGSQ